MRHYLFGFGLLLPLLQLACSAENIVAGEEKTQAEQLKSALPSWCAKTCTRLRACPASQSCDCSPDACNCQGVDETCEENCPRAFARFTDGSEACAAVGLRVEKCFDGMTCSELDGTDPCPTTAAERDLCPEMDDSSDPPSAATGSGPSYSGGTAGNSAGPNGDSAAPSMAGNGPVASPVTCVDSSAAGGGGPDGGGAHVTCEEERAECTDGHVYSWLCAEDSQGQRACTCLVDSRATGGFVPISSDCPPLSHVNAGCAWALTN
jgi:hypothetical protein